MLNLESIQNIIKKSRPDNNTGAIINSKREAINLYEDTKDIKVCDSAYPMEWAKAMRDHFGIKNIGDWCWAYKAGAAFGYPLPCCQRSLVLLEILLSKYESTPLIYKGNYQDKAA